MRIRKKRWTNMSPAAVNTAAVLALVLALISPVLFFFSEAKSLNEVEEFGQDRAQLKNSDIVLEENEDPGKYPNLRQAKSALLFVRFDFFFSKYNLNIAYVFYSKNSFISKIVNFLCGISERGQIFTSFFLPEIKIKT